MIAKRNKTLVAGFFMALLVAVFVVYPEIRARNDAKELCETFEINTTVNIDRPSLDAMTKALKTRFKSLYSIGYFTEEKDRQSNTGAIIFVFLGGFPFGREFCVLNMNNDVVLAKHTIFAADDYRYCDGDVRFTTECSDYR